MRKSSIIFLLIATSFCLKAQTREMKVSSFNVRNDNSSDEANGNGWKNRYPVIANMILFHDLDIVGTQECKSNQVKDLKDALSEYNYDYIGRGRGQNPTDDEYSAIFYNADRFKLIDSGDFWLSETPDVPSIGWDAVLNRICTWGQFEDKATNFKFFAFNLHMDHVGVNARKYSSSLVMKKILEIADGNPTFLTGDFNTDQYAEGYKILTGSCLLTDSYVSAPIVYDSNGTFSGFDTKNTTNQRIDHVFISKDFTAMRYGVLTDIYWTDKNGEVSHPGDFPKETKVRAGTPRLPSDHYPVVVEVEF